MVLKIRRSSWRGSLELTNEYNLGSPEDTNEAQVAADMYAFLQAWFKLHPEYQKQKFYVT